MIVGGPELDEAFALNTIGHPGGRCEEILVEHKFSQKVQEVKFSMRDDWGARVQGVSFIGNELSQEYNLGDTNDESQMNFEIPTWEGQFLGLSGIWPTDNSGLGSIKTLVLIKNQCISDDYHVWDDWYNKNHREAKFYEFLELHQEQFQMEELLQGGSLALSAGFMALLTLVVGSL